MRIFITGCAVSGTTLLQRMFYSFKEIEIIDREINLNKFLSYKQSEKILIGKRNYKTIFSNEKKKINYNSQINLIQKTKKLSIINIIRDGRDVIENGKVSLNRWSSSINQFNENKDLIDLIIKYEDFVKDPDIIQDKIIKKYNMEKLYNFSEYPIFVPDKNFSITKNKKMYRPRKISTDRIGKNLNLYKSRGTVKEIKKFEKMLKTIGYI